MCDAPSASEIDALEERGHFRHRHAARRQGVRMREASVLETLVEKQEAGVVPPQELRFIAALADEDEHGPAERVAAEGAVDELRQTVDAAAHIDWLAADEGLRGGQDHRDSETRAMIASTTLLAAVPDSDSRTEPSWTSTSASLLDKLARSGTGRNSGAFVGARAGVPSSRRRHLTNALRGTPRTEQNAETVSPEARCSSSNRCHPSTPRRIRFFAIAASVKAANDAQLSLQRQQGWFSDGY
ncbi:MAG TPA: hypothetical protein VMU47_10250 [Caldimonas sp.]|nr:hypothetical protein [Caldimonas sp.]